MEKKSRILTIALFVSLLLPSVVFSSETNTEKNSVSIFEKVIKSMQELVGVGTPPNKECGAIPALPKISNTLICKIKIINPDFSPEWTEGEPMELETTIFVNIDTKSPIKDRETYSLFKINNIKLGTSFNELFNLNPNNHMTTIKQKDKSMVWFSPNNLGKVEFGNNPHVEFNKETSELSLSSSFQINRETFQLKNSPTKYECFEK